MSSASTPGAAPDREPPRTLVAGGNLGEAFEIRGELVRRFTQRINSASFPSGLITARYSDVRVFRHHIDQPFSRQRLQLPHAAQDVLAVVFHRRSDVSRDHLRDIVKQRQRHGPAGIDALPIDIAANRAERMREERYIEVCSATFSGSACRIRLQRLMKRSRNK